MCRPSVRQCMAGGGDGDGIGDGVGNAAAAAAGQGGDDGDGGSRGKQGDIVDGTRMQICAEPMNATLFPGDGSDACKRLSRRLGG